MTPEMLAMFKEFIKGKTGLFFSEEKNYFLESRIAKRIKQSGAHNDMEYYRNIKQDRAEFQQLVDLLTVSETFFMRELPYLELVARRLVPEMSRRASAPINILSAGSATGEEIYSLMMLLRHYNFPLDRVSTLGLDINNTSLDKARAGLYTENSIRHLGKEQVSLLDSFLERGKDGIMKVSRDLVDRARFVHGNLFDGLAGLGPFDLVMLRNTLIYIAPDLRPRVLSNIKDSMRRGSYLILGQVEIAGGTGGLFAERKMDGLSVFVKEG